MFEIQFDDGDGGGTKNALTERLLERFISYVKIHTTSDENSETTPSTQRQFDLARILTSELREMGLDAQVDQHGYVYTIIPENLPADHPASGKVPAIGFIAHMDTSPDASGENVKPMVIRGYDGSDIVLSGDPNQVLRPSEISYLGSQQGKDLIVTDGTTLLGADDKAGVAEIMEAAQRWSEDDSLLHGPICIGFTPDEEIGRGADKFNVEGFGATIAYTLDGSELGTIEKETFNAHGAVYTIKGYNVHPGSAKDKMINAIYAIGEILQRLPEDMRPETTENREGFIHPRLVTGNIDECEIHLLVRDFDMEQSRAKIKLLEQIRDEVKARLPKVEISLDVKERYLNMGPKVDEDPRIVEFALEACRKAGIEPKVDVIRGGTDGARLSYMGILTPNVFTGGCNYHSVREWASLDDMESATQVLMNIATLWVEKGATS
jgi:tripeptide aminopeptidase